MFLVAAKPSQQVIYYMHASQRFQRDVHAWCSCTMLTLSRCILSKVLYLLSLLPGIQEAKGRHEKRLKLTSSTDAINHSTN